MKYFLFVFLFLSLGAHAAGYWVKKTGSDSNSCIGEANACLTINKGLSLAVAAGDTLDIGEGTYVENSTNSPWLGNCGLLDGNVSSLCVMGNGAEGNPIIIRAAPGAERKVIIDSQYLRSGISLRKMDYIHIKNLVFKNVLTAGIANPGGPAPTDGAPLEVNLSIGCVIEGNIIDGLVFEDGVNASGIYFWSTKNWVIRNNYIDLHDPDIDFGTTHANGMQTYGAINVLIENNTVVRASNGVYFKDHYIASANPLTYTEEATVRNNLFVTKKNGVVYWIRGTRTNPAGNNVIEGNIMEHARGYTSIVYTGVAVASGTSAINGSFTIRNNIIYSYWTTGYMISVANASSTSILNNIAIGGDTAIRCRYTADAYTIFQCNLDQSNYNIFGSTAKFNMDDAAAQEATYSTLAAWKAATDAQSFSLKYNNPDANSVSVNSNSFASHRPRMYRNFPNTVGGQKAGVYQTGSELIGANFTYRAAPSAPN